MKLTPRQKEILPLLAMGKSSWVIGVLLGISQNTVDFHVKDAMQRLDACNRVQLCCLAISAGIIDPVYQENKDKHDFNTTEQRETGDQRRMLAAFVARRSPHWHI